MLALAADLFRAKDHHAALRLLEGVIEADPSDMLARFNAGQACMEIGDYAVAMDHFGAVAEQDGNWRAWLKLGTAALLEQDHERAALALAEALLRKPDNPDVQNTYGSLLATKLDDDNAIAHYREAQRLRPDYAEPHVGEAFCLLRQGRYREGWAKFEKRWERPNSGQEYHGLPMWIGEHCGTVVLRSEQGFGDSMQFCRYIPLVAGRVFEVVVEAHPLLHRLIEGIPGVAEVIDTNAEPPAADAWASLMSLPYIFGTTLDTIPPPVPWCLPPATRNGSFKAGICWAGGSRVDEPAAHATDKRRSLTFEQIAPILAVPCVEWVSLQKDGNHLPGPIDGCRDFYATVRLIQHVDVVVTVDTAICHLAATMGKSTLLMNRYDTCWRWLLGCADSPWYPSVQVFRQPSLGNWKPVIAAIAEAVREMAG